MAFFAPIVPEVIDAVATEFGMTMMAAEDVTVAEGLGGATRAKQLVDQFYGGAGLMQSAAGVLGSALALPIAGVTYALTHIGQGASSAASASAATQSHGTSVRTPGIKTSKKKVSFKKKKSVKVSRKFKAAVRKVTSGDDIHGTYSQISYGQLFDPQDNGQQKNTFRMLQNSDYNVWAFDQEDWLHMVSVLWNQKGDSQTSRPWQADSNIGNPTNQVVPMVSPAQTSDGNNAEFLVKNSWETRLFKNNSLRTQLIHMYICAPKDCCPKRIVEIDQIGQPASSWDHVDDLVDFWTQCVEQDRNAGKNVSNATIQTYGMSPEANSTFKKYFKVERITIVLEPGQTYKHFLQGPSNFFVKFDKFFKNKTYLGLQKHMRGVLYTIVPGLVNSNDGKVGRFTSDDTLGVAVELTRYASFKMPEQTALRFRLNDVNIGATYDLKNNLRRNCYAHYVYVVPPGANKYRVDAQNPISIQSLLSKLCNF